jgi:hypothetical protein
MRCPAPTTIATFRVPSKPEWFATPVLVQAGETITIEAKGIWVDAHIPCSADGYWAALFYWLGFPPRIADGDRYFRLMGRIGDPGQAPTADSVAETFVIGSRPPPIRMPRAGRLYVFANDRVGRYGNNWGCVTLTVSRA